MPNLKTQGTQLYYVSGPTAATVLAKIVSVDGLGGPRDQIDVTHLMSEEREFEAGFANPGQVTLEIIFDPAEASHEALLGLKDSGDKVPWMIASSDATTAPTVVASAFSALTTRTNWVFTAYVADFNLNFNSNEVVRGTVTLQRSGAVAFTKKA